MAAQICYTCLYYKSCSYYCSPNSTCKYYYEKYKTNFEDIAIRASRQAELTRNQLLDTLYEDGVLAVYNLGMKHMYEYLKGENNESVNINK